MSRPLRIGTRRSALALAQARSVVRLIRKIPSAPEVELVAMSTSGDRSFRPSRTLDFTDAIEEALVDGGVDLAVHSAKDLTVRPRRSLEILAYPRRSDPRESVVSRSGSPLQTLATGARVGSSSLRRQAQLLRWRPDLHIVPLRGNVDRRLAKLDAGEVDAIVLARAGLVRLRWGGRSTEVVSPRRMLPPPGQGALAVQGRRSDRRLAALLRRIDHPSTRAAVSAERALAAELGGDCNLPLAAWAHPRGATGLELTAEVLSPDGRRSVRGTMVGTPEQPEKLGRELGARLLRSGAGEVLRVAS
ncbi:MAG TPA: hydroxymethylbilane synthase [Thermoplasmata archaeon]|nr:hydroxymethylbilane synthase [Thermoplasmata archaeon]